tara:strand:+ start:599 stop:898 length:300 start_codon:yes stop_codon:yes gene_type:complete
MAKGGGFLLNVQTDLLSGLNTRVVVPLLQLTEAPIPAQRLNPILEVDNVEVIMATQFLAAVPETELKVSVGNLDGSLRVVSGYAWYSTDPNSGASEYSR